MIGPDELEAALPELAHTGLPLLVHAELAEYLDHGGDADDWRQYATWLRSRPDEAELAAIRMLIGLCRKYRFRLHIVHVSTALALEPLALARAEGLPVTVETCPHYLHFVAEEIPCRGNALQVRAAHTLANQPGSAVARAARWSYRFDRDRSLPLPALHEARRFPPGMGRNCQPLRGGVRNLDRDAQAWLPSRGLGALDVSATRETCRDRGAQRSHRRRMGCGPGGLRS